MNESDQTEVIAFLSRPETFGGNAVERIDTHISIVFLAGDKAYKLKRAVVFPYLDFSTLARRRRFCEAEIAVNRRTAPEIYERVAAVTRDPSGALGFDGPGPALDYVVVMKRFDQGALFDRLADRGWLSETLLTALADEIARFHRKAERRFDFGGYDGIARVVAQNAQSLQRHADRVFESDTVVEYGLRGLGALQKRRELLEARRQNGYVRHCHGDLHLRNICLCDGKPTLFDAIEFSDDIACIDVLYDLAFLLMDLERRGLRAAGNLVFNRYLAGEDEAALAGLEALPLFLSCRAAVRAHVDADAALAQSGGTQAERLLDESRDYLRLAMTLLSPEPARLIAVGGLSGTGKSSLAKTLAPKIGPVPGAVVLRSDIIRKTLFGAAETARLPAEAYAAPIGDRVYAAIGAKAEAALKAGHAVIADAVYARPGERAALEAVAVSAGVPFTGLWLEAPAAVLERRIGARRGDASDATVEVLRQQQEYAIGDMTWRRIQAGGEFWQTLAAAFGVLDLAAPGSV